MHNVANKEVMGGGVSLLIIALLGFIIPVTYEGFTYPQLDSLCNSGIMDSLLMQLFGKIVMGEKYMEQVAQECRNAKIITWAIYGFGIAGFIVTGVGSMAKGKKKHLEKISGYVCEHCAFIGRTEGELLDHHNEKYPS